MMTQEGNILIWPFRNAFPEAGNATELLVSHPHFPQNLWVWIDPDKVSLRYGAATRKTMTVHLVEREDCCNLMTKSFNNPTEVYAHGWLHLAEQLEQPEDAIRTEMEITSLILMRQIGGDPGYAGAYTLKGDFDD